MTRDALKVTEEEIKQLPRRAQVAFAARCARRVQPLFLALWRDAPEGHVDAVDWAITSEAYGAARATTSRAAALHARAAAARIRLTKAIGKLRSEGGEIYFDSENLKKILDAVLPFEDAED